MARRRPAPPPPLRLWIPWEAADRKHPPPPPPPPAPQGLVSTATVWLGAYLFLVFLSLCVATGLFYLADIVEEHPRVAQRLLRRAAAGTAAAHLLLAADGQPPACVAAGIAAHTVRPSPARFLRDSGTGAEAARGASRAERGAPLVARLSPNSSQVYFRLLGSFPRIVPSSPGFLAAVCAFGAARCLPHATQRTVSRRLCLSGRLTRRPHRPAERRAGVSNYLWRARAPLRTAAAPGPSRPTALAQHTPGRRH